GKTLFLYLLLHCRRMQQGGVFEDYTSVVSPFTIVIISDFSSRPSSVFKGGKSMPRPAVLILTNPRLYFLDNGPVLKSTHYAYLIGIIWLFTVINHCLTIILSSSSL